MHVTLTRFERPRSDVHGEARAMPFDDAVELSEAGNGTALLAVMRTMPKGLIQLAAPMIGVIRTQFQTNRDQLRGAIESQQR